VEPDRENPSIIVIIIIFTLRARIANIET